MILPDNTSMLAVIGHVRTMHFRLSHAHAVTHKTALFFLPLGLGRWITTSRHRRRDRSVGRRSSRSNNRNNIMSDLMRAAVLQGKTVRRETFLRGEGLATVSPRRRVLCRVGGV